MYIHIAITVFVQACLVEYCQGSLGMPVVSDKENGKRISLNSKVAKKLKKNKVAKTISK